MMSTVRTIAFGLGVFFVLPPAATPLAAQATGTVRGTVTRAHDDAPAAGASVSIVALGRSTVADARGRYILSGVRAGRYALLIRMVGFAPRDIPITVVADSTLTVDVTLTAQPVELSQVVVTAASRAPERIVDAPAAVSVVPTSLARAVAITGQAPRALASLTGVDVVQAGMFDFDVNTRGFNSGLNRRMLLLQDGRDQSLSFIGIPEWIALNTDLDGRIEVVRGPGSALYGANAYLGVIDYTTPTVSDDLGTKLTLSGGGMQTTRADFSTDAMSRSGSWGYRVTGGIYRSDGWARARTSLDGRDLRREYLGTSAADSAPLTTEAVPLAGQTVNPLTGAAVGEPSPILLAHGSARVDFYRGSGSVITAEAGSEYTDNAVFTGPTGRFQVHGAIRPWARLMWSADRFNLSAWWAGEFYAHPVTTLSTGGSTENASQMVHTEAQYHTPFMGGRGRLVLGGSVRQYFINTKGTILGANDHRTDRVYSGYGQTDFYLTRQIRLVAAARYDKGDIFSAQLSPKAGIVFAPSMRHAVRFTVNRAFLTPDYTSLFLDLAAAPPVDLTALEQGLRNSPLGPSLSGVPDGTLFTNSAAVPVLAEGNPTLRVEHVTAYELGYKGQFGNHLYLTLDGYYNRMTDFVTDLLPGVNPMYPRWTAPPQVNSIVGAILAQTVHDQLVAAGQPLVANALTRLPDGSTAIVLSYGNAGRVNAYGVELGTGLVLGGGLRFDANWSLFMFQVDSATLVAGDALKPNTPKNKINVSASYDGANGMDFRVSARLVGGYDWADGVYAGPVPASQTVDVSAGYQLSHGLRVQAIATNLFDERHFEMFGGSVIGRRILAGATATF